MKEVWAGGGMFWAYICLNIDRKETMETEVDIGMDECRAQGEVLLLDRDTRILLVMEKVHVLLELASSLVSFLGKSTSEAS